MARHAFKTIGEYEAEMAKMRKVAEREKSDRSLALSVDQIVEAMYWQRLAKIRSIIGLLQRRPELEGK